MSRLRTFQPVLSYLFRRVAIDIGLVISDVITKDIKEILYSIVEYLFLWYIVSDIRYFLFFLYF